MSSLYNSLILSSKMLFVIGLCLLYVLFSRHSLLGVLSGKTRSKSSSHRRTQSSSNDKKVPSSSSGQATSRTFTFRELAAATKNFRADCILGEGGFGPVYKGMLDGNQVGTSV